MKKFALIAAALVLVLALGACKAAAPDEAPTMSTQTVQNEDGTTSLVKNGTETFTFTVGENETCEVTMKFDNESGSVSAYIARDGIKKDAIYTGNDIPSGEFTVTATEPGEYKICYETTDYIGTYTYSTAVK